MNQYIRVLKNLSPLNESSDQPMNQCFNCEFQKTLALLDCVTIANDKSFRAIIGFDQEDKPVYWNMKEGHLLGCANTGAAMNYLGASLAILDLSSRFSKEEFGYYYVGDEKNYFSPKNDEHCIDAGSLFCMEGYDQRGNYHQVLEKIHNEWDARKKLSEEEIAKSKAIVVLFGNAIHSIPESRELCLNLLENGLRYHIYVIYLSTRLLYEKEWCELNGRPINLSWFSGMTIGKSDSELSQYVLHNEKAQELDARKHYLVYQYNGQQMVLYHNYQSVAYFLLEKYINDCKNV